VQAGRDLAGWDNGDSSVERLGILAGWSRGNGDVGGDVLAQSAIEVGYLQISGTSLGVYWTNVEANNAYFEGLLVASLLDGHTRSTRNARAEIDGTAVSLSLEGGYPILLTPVWSFEPQVQAIWQAVSLDDSRDQFSTLDFNAPDGLRGRIGSRLQGQYPLDDALMQAYLKANIWQSFASDNSAILGVNAIHAEDDGPALELGGGINMEWSTNMHFYASGGYTTSLDDGSNEVIEGSLGARVIW
jgi:outer membrane autotransporter protein